MSNYVQILLSDARGVYIPRDFVQGFHMDAWHITNKDAIDTLQDPENEGYWDAWIYDIEQNAYYIDADGHKWTLYQDGDLFAIREDMPEEDAKEFFGEC